MDPQVAIRVGNNSGIVDLTDNWYYVDGNVTVGEINVTGNVQLILCDGAYLTVNGGVHVTTGNTISIFCQSGESGSLFTTGSDEWAGIGGGEYDTEIWTDGGTIIIHGGAITASGGDYAAGIGGGPENPYEDGIGSHYGKVIIYEGSIVAQGSDQGGTSAGIGGGAYSTGGEISIYGGIILASGEGDGAGIGGGGAGINDIISIYGGSFIATGKNGGAGIGRGANGAGGTVTIYGGQITSNSILSDTVSLSWINAADYIRSGGYGGSVKAEKEFLIDGGPDVLQEGEVSDPDAIANKELTPLGELHTVTFDSDGAAEVPAQQVPHGGQAQKPEDPEAPDGTVFAGWYQVVNGEMEVIEFDFAAPITEDITLKAFFGPDEGGADFYRIAAMDGAPEIDSENLRSIAETVLTQDEIDCNYGLVLVSAPYAESDVPEAERFEE